MIISLPIRTWLLLTSSRVIFAFYVAVPQFDSYSLWSSAVICRLLSPELLLMQVFFIFISFVRIYFPPECRIFCFFFFFHCSLSHWFLTLTPINQNHFWILIRPPSLQPWWAGTFIGFINVASNPFVNCINNNICQKQPWETPAGLPSFPPGLTTSWYFPFPPAHGK